MAIPRGAQRIGEILVRAGLLDASQVKSGLAHLEQWGGRLPKNLADLGLADEDEMAAAIAQAYGLGAMPLARQPKDAAALRVFDPKYCQAKAVFPVSLKDRVLTLAVADPSDLQAMDEAMARAPCRVQLVVATETAVLNAVERHYFNRTPRLVSNKARKAVTRDLPLQGLAEAIELDQSPPPHPDEEALAPGETFDFGDGAPPLPPEVLARLEAVKKNQEKTSLMLRVVRELLLEKGLLGK